MTKLAHCLSGQSAGSGVDSSGIFVKQHNSFARRMESRKEESQDNYMSKKVTYSLCLTYPKLPNSALQQEGK